MSSPAVGAMIFGAKVSTAENLKHAISSQQLLGTKIANKQLPLSEEFRLYETPTELCHDYINMKIYFWSDFYRRLLWFWVIFL